jgi:5-formyltetrahydrofolate cyclo-ligase
VLPATARAARSAATVARVLELPEFARARTLVAFSALPKELDLSELLTKARQLGKRVGLPRVRGDAQTLELREVAQDAQLVEGAFGVFEPEPSAPLIDPADVDLALVPGLAFDARGHRIGYGRAFYDRLLPLLPRAFRIGVAFDFQFVSELPDEPHDVPMHCIVSDARCLRI